MRLTTYGKGKGCVLIRCTCPSPLPFFKHVKDRHTQLCQNKHGRYVLLLAVYRHPFLHAHEQNDVLAKVGCGGGKY